MKKAAVTYLLTAAFWRYNHHIKTAQIPKWNLSRFDIYNQEKIFSVFSG